MLSHSFRTFILVLFCFYWEQNRTSRNKDILNANGCFDRGQIKSSVSELLTGVSRAAANWGHVQPWHERNCAPDESPNEAGAGPQRVASPRAQTKSRPNSDECAVSSPGGCRGGQPAEKHCNNIETATSVSPANILLENNSNVLRGTTAAE